MAPRKKQVEKDSNSKLEMGVMSTSGKEIEKIDLDPVIFDGKINHALMHQAVVTYLANQRRGLANTKTRGEVSGGGRKPWKQKGTGRARSGSSRSPIWKGGGITFGPKPHSFVKDFPKKMKAMALKSALNAKLKDSEIVVFDSLKMNAPKTKEFAAVISNSKVSADKALIVLGALDVNVKLSARNIARVGIQEAKSLNTYDALSYKKLVFAKDA